MMFGGKRSFFDAINPEAPGAAQGGAMQFPQMPDTKLSLMNKLGLAGDILTGRNVTEQRLQPEIMAAAQARQQQMRLLQPQQVGDSLVRLNPQTGAYDTLYSAPQKPQADDVFTRALKEAGIVPGSPEWVSAHSRRAATLSSPQPQFVPDGLGGGQYVTPPLAALGGAPTAPVGQLKPVGKLTPIQGGPTPSASGGFR